VFNTVTQASKWEDGPNRLLDYTDSFLVLNLDWNSLAPTDISDEPQMSKEEKEARARERKEASDLIASMFAIQVAAALPGTPWAASPVFSDKSEKSDVTRSDNITKVYDFYEFSSLVQLVQPGRVESFQKEKLLVGATIPWVMMGSA
jgi:hypothetical protein